MKNLVSQSEYARLCGVSRQAISDRIKNNVLLLCDGKHINIVDFPPMKLSRGRKVGSYKGIPKIKRPAGRPLVENYDFLNEDIKYDFPNENIKADIISGKKIA